MKFLIQKINGEIKHDFAFTLLESIRYNNWLENGNKINFKYLNTLVSDEPDDISPLIQFKPYHKKYVPIGSVEFVTQFLQHFYNLTPKPINVPVELFPYAGRTIINDNETRSFGLIGNWFIKSNDKIKGYKELQKSEDYYDIILPYGNYQYSKYINIESEWRAFVYEGKLVGLQNYGGNFRLFPNVQSINEMITAYKSAPIAYTLDVLVDTQFQNEGTYVCECHDFISCGLYGFADHKLLPYMFYRSFNEQIKKNEKQL